jgi:hypothetical protein
MVGVCRLQHYQRGQAVSTTTMALMPSAVFDTRRSTSGPAALAATSRCLRPTRMPMNMGLLLGDEWVAQWRSPELRRTPAL